MRLSARRLWLGLCLCLLLSSVSVLSAPKPAAPAKPPPKPVLCQLVVHVVQAGTSDPVPGILVSVLAARVTTDSGGVARFKQVPNHPVIVTVQAADLPQVKIAPNPKHVLEVTIPVHAYVSVTVQAQAGEAGSGFVEGATVSIDDREVGVTDPSGRFTQRLMAGTHTVKLTHGAYVFVPSMLNVRLTGLEETITLPFQARPITGRFKIRVVARQAASLVPVEGATVQLVRDPDNRTTTLTTGADGSVLTEPLTLGRYTVTVQAAGMTFPPPDGEVALSAPGEVWLTIEGTFSP